jgi:hypothetical protein
MEQEFGAGAPGGDPVEEAKPLGRQLDMADLPSL